MVDRGLLQVTGRGAPILRSMVAVIHRSLAVSRRMNPVTLRLTALTGRGLPILGGLSTICRRLLVQLLHVVPRGAGKVPRQRRLQRSTGLIALFCDLVTPVSAQIAPLPGLVPVIRPVISFVGCLIAFVGRPVTFVGRPVTLISRAVALVGRRVPSIPRPVPLIGRVIRFDTGLVPLHRRTVTLVRDLAALTLHLAASQLRVVPRLGSPLSRPHGLNRSGVGSTRCADVLVLSRRTSQSVLWRRRLIVHA